MINGKVYFCEEDCYGVIVFPMFLIIKSIYLELGDFDYIGFYKPVEQSLVPYIIFDLPKDYNCFYNCSCLEVIFENRPSIQFAVPSDIQKWVLFRCNLCSIIEFNLHALEYQLSSYIKNISVIESIYDLSKVISIKSLYYLRKWMSTLGLKIDTNTLE